MDENSKLGPSAKSAIAPSCAYLIEAIGVRGPYSPALIGQRCAPDGGRAYYAPLSESHGGWTTPSPLDGAAA